MSKLATTDRDSADQADEIRHLGSAAREIAHEIRNPLHGIRGFAALLLSRMEEADPNRGLVDQIMACADGLNDILRGLADFAEADGPLGRRANVAQAIEDALRSARTALADKHLSVQAAVDDACPDVAGERGQIHGLVLNLLLNAARASYEAGQVSVSASMTADGENVCISVKDHGCGIPRAMLAKVFDEGVTDKPGSKGLGLSIVQRVTEALGGSVEIASQQGEGTEVRLTLPRRGAAASDESAEQTQRRRE